MSLTKYTGRLNRNVYTHISKEGNRTMQNIVTLFKTIAEENDSKIAVIANGHEYTYKHLDEYSNYVAIRVSKAAQKGDRIGICIERSITLIAAILGVLKAGMSYVPLDNSYPRARLQYMCNETNVKCIICRKGSDWSFIENQIVLEDAVSYRSEFSYEEGKEAYVIFTSGSTGRPKGVAINHASIMNTILWRMRYFSLNTRDRVLQIPSVSYSSSVEDIFSTLLSGGTLIMINQKDLLNVKKMAHIIIQQGVTHLLLIPSLYNELIPYLQESKLRFVVVAGEAITPQIITKHYRYLKHVYLYNEYGMTETSVAFSVSLISSTESRCNIGRPIDNMGYLLAELEEGIGELVIIGPGVAFGYINDEFNSRFINVENTMGFHTGDLVKVDDDGNLIYCGRKDNQIKRNGKRFDLTEISQILKEELNVEAVAIVNKKNKIVCFMCSTNTSMKENALDVLRDKIPMDFLPKKFEMMDCIYKLPNGKIDYGKLIEYEEGEI